LRALAAKCIEFAFPRRPKIFFLSRSFGISVGSFLFDDYHFFSLFLFFFSFCKSYSQIDNIVFAGVCDFGGVLRGFDRVVGSFVLLRCPILGDVSGGDPASDFHLFNILLNGASEDSGGLSRLVI
jgi:hypothetical protein